MHFVGPDQLHGYEERVTTDVSPADFLWSPDRRLGDESWLEWYHGMDAVLDAGPHRRGVDVACDDEVEFEAVRLIQHESPGAPPCCPSPILNGPDADNTNAPGRMESHRG